MQKDHLIQLHAFLLQIRTYIETIYEDESAGLFNSYDDLHIHPHEVHKSKDQQQIAIFELIKNISTVLKEVDPTSNFPKLSKTLDFYCNKLQKKE